MSPGQLPSDSIKVVPGRSKLRVESPSPVPTGNPIPRPSKVKFISPEEIRKLASADHELRVFQVPTPSRPVRDPPIPEATRPVKVPTSEVPRPVLADPAGGLRKEIVCGLRTSRASEPVRACPIPKPPRPFPTVSTSEAPRPVLANPVEGLRKEIVCGLRALSLSTKPVKQQNNPIRLQSKTVESSPRGMQISSRTKQQVANGTQVVKGTSVEVGGRANGHGPKETLQSLSEENLLKLLEYRPALHPTRSVCIMDSAMPPEFDCDFWAKPASTISSKALRLSKAMPSLLKAELLPICHTLNDVFGRIPTLMNVEMYLFPDEKKTERSKGRHTHLFEAMETRNAMMKLDINDTKLLIFSSKLLDKTSQSLINTQKKTDNFLWGFFSQDQKNSLEIVPGTASQIDKYLDDRDVVDMDLYTD